MKAFRISFLVVDHNNEGLASILEEVDISMRYNSLSFLSSDEIEFGEWSDDHPLNMKDQQKEFFEKALQRKKKLESDKIMIRTIEKMYQDSMSDPNREPSLHEHLFLDACCEKPREKCSCTEEKKLFCSKVCDRGEE